MGNNNSKMRVEHTENRAESHIGKPINVQKKSQSYGYSNRDQFVPLFTTKTATVVHGFIRQELFKNNMNEIIPLELIEIIYKFIKNNCTFIIIFENDDDPQHSYLHELDIESGTNKNLSAIYKHSDYIWKRASNASYCYGQYNEQTAIYRIGGDQQSIACILKTGETIEIPEIRRTYSQIIYSSKHGLFVVGGHDNYKQLRDVLHFNKEYKKWDKTIDPMIERRCEHFSVFYESHHYDISDKIYCLGGRNVLNEDSKTDIYDVQLLKKRKNIKPGKPMECYDFGKQKWEKIGNTIVNGTRFGGCFDKETETIIVGGSDFGHIVKEYNFEKDWWYNIGGHTHFGHNHYPKITKHNKVVVMFGNDGYSNYKKDYGYVEYLDQRNNDNKWIVLSSLREMLQFTGNQVRARFYQHMLQM